jgi:DNA modification methylase
MSNRISYFNKDFLTSECLLEDNSVDLFIIDPLYGVGYDSWDISREEFPEHTEKWVDIIYKKLSPTGTAWIFMAKDNLFTSRICRKGLLNILEETPGIVHRENDVVWSRQKGRGSSKHLKSQREDLVHFTKTNNFVWNEFKLLREVIAPYVKDGRPRGWFTNDQGKHVRWTGLGNIWVFTSPQYNSKLDKQRHSAQKPFLLIERLLLLSSNPNQLTVDPFFGSGVSAIVSKYHNRKYIGFEKDEKIFNDSTQFINLNYDEIIAEYEAQKRSGLSPTPSSK